MPDGSFKELSLKQYRGRYVILVMYPREKEGGGKGGEWREAGEVGCNPCTWKTSLQAPHVD